MRRSEPSAPRITLVLELLNFPSYTRYGRRVLPLQERFSAPRTLLRCPGARVVRTSIGHAGFPRSIQHERGNDRTRYNHPQDVHFGEQGRERRAGDEGMRQVPGDIPRKT